MKKNSNLSLKNSSLKSKLFVAVGLMSVLPLLGIIYVFNMYFPLYDNFRNIIFFIAICFFIAFTGFVIIKQIIDPVIRMAKDAKLILKGKLDHSVIVEREDEVGQLGLSLNHLTRRIRNDMDELRAYGEKTKEINLEINRKVIVLSSLLQIGNLISQGAKSKEIFEVMVEKVAQIGESQAGFLYLLEEGTDELVLKTSFSLLSKDIKNTRFKLGEGLFGKMLEENLPVVSDSLRQIAPDDRHFLIGLFRFKNIFLYPIYTQSNPMGVLGIANNRENFSFRDDDAQLMELFGRQVSIIVINDMLIRQAEKLEIRDSLTGLYNERFIRLRLDEEIKRAIIYQRPCSFILITVDDFKAFHSIFGELSTEQALKKMAIIVEDSLGDIDKAARFGDEKFAVVLPEKNKKEALEITTQLKKKIDFAFSEETDKKKRLTVTARVSENPIDGITAEELIKAASEK